MATRAQIANRPRRAVTIRDLDQIKALRFFNVPLTPEETAILMGCSRAWVMKVEKRALAKIRKVLEQRM